MKSRSHIFALITACGFLLVFTVIKLSGIVAISKLMKPSEKQIEEARQKRLQAEKEGKDPFEDWDERDDDGLV